MTFQRMSRNKMPDTNSLAQSSSAQARDLDMPAKVATLLRATGAREFLDLNALKRAHSTDTGAYILIIRLDASLTVARRNTRHELDAGWYLYAGSARGPGGIKARLRRHFKLDKSIHWHIDHLTTAGSVVAACAFPGGNECDLAQRLARYRACDFGPNGFGSSDCRECRSHLICIL